MLISRDEVLKRLCALCDVVNAEFFNHEIPSDCFCGEKPFDKNEFQFDSAIISRLHDLVFNEVITNVKDQEKIQLMDKIDRRV